MMIFRPLPSHSSKIPNPISSLRGFTLIELLVVISIIGMLSSVVLVSLSSARDKGKVAAGIKFARHSLAGLSTGNVQFSYSFNDSGTTAAEGLGSQNSLSLNPGVVHLTYCNTSATRSSVTPDGQGSSLSVANNSCAKFATPPPISTGAGTTFTFAYWMKTTDTSGCIFCNRTGGYISNGVSGGKPSTYINGSSVNGASTATFFGNASISDDKWHHVAWSWTMTSGSNVCNSSSSWTYTIYVDGKIDKPATAFTTIYCIPTGTGAYLAYDPGNSSFKYAGLIDDFRFFDKALAHGDIERLYAQGAVERGITLNK